MYPLVGRKSALKFIAGGGYVACYTAVFVSRPKLKVNTTVQKTPKLSTEYLTKFLPTLSSHRVTCSASYPAELTGGLVRTQQLAPTHPSALPARPRVCETSTSGFAKVVCCVALVCLFFRLLVVAVVLCLVVVWSLCRFRIAQQSD